jgi:uncharacterized protein YrrD
VALFIAGPAISQQTGAAQQDAQQQPGQQQAQQQQTGQDQQQVGQDQQMAGQQGFYQPQANDLFVSELMDAQVYAPAERAEQQPGQQQGQMQQQPGQQQQTGAAQQPGQQQAQQQEQAAEQQQQAAEQQEQAAEQQQQTAQQPQQEQAAQQQEQAAEQQQQAAEQQQQAAEQQQEQPGQQQQVGAQQQPGQMQQQQPGMQRQGFRERQVTQDDLGQMENIGSVSDVIMDEQGEVQAVVLDVGGFLGIGARQVALSMDQIEFGRDQDDPDSIVVISQIGANELENAPEFDRDQLRQDRQWQEGGQQQQMVGTQQQQPGQMQQRDQQAQQQTEQQRAAQPGAQQDQWRGDRQTMVAPQMQREGMQQAQPAEITADNLIGANVYDVNDENIGSVSDVIMDPQGQAQYAVVDIGGFLGLGTHTVAIGFDEMQVLHDEGWADLRVYVDATQEQLENMPEYEQN